MAIVVPTLSNAFLLFVVVVFGVPIIASLCNIENYIGLVCSDRVQNGRNIFNLAHEFNHVQIDCSPSCMPECIFFGHIFFCSLK